MSLNDPIDLLYEIRRLMELKGENPFKIRAFENAAHQLSERDDLMERAKSGTLTEIPGVGKGISEVLSEFLLQGRSTVREELEKSLPPGLAELTTVSGLGPKKAMLLIEKLGIHSLGELEYACQENRLLRLKGFGSKIQQKILEDLLFKNSNQGYKKLSEANLGAEEFSKFLLDACPGIKMSEVGPLRRKLEVLQKLDYLVVDSLTGSFQEEIQAVLTRFLALHPRTLPIGLHFCPPKQFGFELARLTGTEEHWEALGSPCEFECKTEVDFFQHLGLPFISPELRETGEEVVLAKSGYLSHLLPWDGLRGIFHNHTTRSDGSSSLEEMVQAAEEQCFEYIGISDHSQSAFYAQGLSESELLEQEKELKEVQSRHPKIKIFFGVESDILADGSLDYPEKILERFDFVIASVHSRFQMDREAMTSRILAAVRNPFTRFLGHPTGRLLLGRKGYEVDLEAILAEAAKQNVAVELNANPARLDIDWRWGKKMREYHTLTSVNPDAHEAGKIKDVHFGVTMARKALFSSDQVINTKSTHDVERWLRRA